MTKEHATWAAEEISKAYGRCILFREPSRRESYQACAGEPSDYPDCTVIARFEGGVQVSL